MTDPCPEGFIEFASQLADANGAHVLGYFQTPLAVESKDDDSPVTAADLEGEQIMRRMIRERYPDHGIAGEEFPPEREDAEYLWLLDPIDGTAAFVAGAPGFGTLIALLRARRPILGVIDSPVLKQRWLGAQGRPTTLDGKPVRVRACQDLSQAILSCASPHYFHGRHREAYERLAERVWLPSYGQFCYAYGLLASGFVDIVTDGGMKPHDYFPLMPIVEGAGGVITDWKGEALSFEPADRVVAAGNRRLLDEALEVLAEEGEV